MQVLVDTPINALLLIGSESNANLMCRIMHAPVYPLALL